MATFKNVSQQVWLEKPLSVKAAADRLALTSEVDLYPKIGDVFSGTVVHTIEFVVAQELVATAALAPVCFVVMETGETPRQGRKILEFSPIAVGTQKFESPTGNWIPEDMQGLDNLRFGLYINELV
jgi:hypothetical protein